MPRATTSARPTSSRRSASSARSTARSRSRSTARSPTRSSARSRSRSYIPKAKAGPKTRARAAATRRPTARGRSGRRRGQKAKDTNQKHGRKRDWGAHKRQLRSNGCSARGCRHGTSDLPLLNRYVALDCEFVAVKGSHSALGRCSIVDAAGRILLDEYSRPKSKSVTNAQWKGIHAKDKDEALPFTRVRCLAKTILRNKILVGHAVQNDLKALNIKHAEDKTRDTSFYVPLRELARLDVNTCPALRALSKKLLGRTIQKGEHCSVEDSQATMDVFLIFRKRWERELLDGIADKRQQGNRQRQSKKQEENKEEEEEDVEEEEEKNSNEERSGRGNSQQPNSGKGRRRAATSRGRAATSRGRAATSSGRAATNRGRAATSRGRAATSRGRAATSRGRAATSGGRAASSRGKASTSRGRVSTSRGKVSTNKGKSSTSKGKGRASKGKTSTARRKTSTSTAKSRCNRSSNNNNNNNNDDSNNTSCNDDGYYSHDDYHWSSKDYLGTVCSAISLSNTNVHSELNQLQDSFSFVTEKNHCINNTRNLALWHGYRFHRNIVRGYDCDVIQYGDDIMKSFHASVPDKVSKCAGVLPSSILGSCYGNNDQFKKCPANLSDATISIHHHKSFDVPTLFPADPLRVKTCSHDNRCDVVSCSSDNPSEVTKCLYTNPCDVTRHPHDNPYDLAIISQDNPSDVTTYSPDIPCDIMISEGNHSDIRRCSEVALCDVTRCSHDSLSDVTRFSLDNFSRNSTCTNDNKSNVTKSLLIVKSEVSTGYNRNQADLDGDEFAETDQERAVLIGSLTIILLLFWVVL